MKCRQPTVEEAREWLTRQYTEVYRIECLAHWRRLYGDQFVEMVIVGNTEKKRK